MNSKNGNRIGTMFAYTLYLPFLLLKLLFKLFKFLLKKLSKKIN